MKSRTLLLGTVLILLVTVPILFVTVPTAKGPALVQAAADPPGKVVYTHWCAACHDPGVQHPGTNALTAKYKGVKSGVLLEWTDLPEDYVKAVARTGISVMPQFRKTEISDQELDALARWMSSRSKK